MKEENIQEIKVISFRIPLNLIRTRRAVDILERENLILNNKIRESEEEFKILKGKEKSKAGEIYNESVKRLLDLNRRKYLSIYKGFKPLRFTQEHKNIYSATLRLLEKKRKFEEMTSRELDKIELRNKREREIKRNKINNLMSDILEGDYTKIDELEEFSKEGEEINVFFTDRFKITFNIKSRVFKLYKRSLDELGIEHLNFFGMFVKLKKFKREEYSISQGINKSQKYIIQIQNTSKTQDDDTLEFNLNESKIIEVAKHVKVGTDKDQFLIECYESFFIWLKSSPIIKTHRITTTNCYGIFNKETILLPNNSKLLSNKLFNKEEEHSERDLELSKFEYNFDTQRIKSYDINQKNEIVTIFKRYLNNSYRARIVTQYSLVSIFRQYLMRELKLKAFGYLILKSNISNTGKSTIVRICSNHLLTGFDSPGYSSDVLRGTTQRFSNLSFMALPIAIDDLSEINNNSSIDLLKTSATFPAGFTTKYPNNKKTTYYNLRNFIISCNRLSIKDPNLVDRFLILNFDNQEIQDKEFKINEHDINYLLDNIEYIRETIWDNIPQFLKVIEGLTEFDSSRENSNNTINNIGNMLLNKLMELLTGDKNTFNDKIGLYLDNGRNSILTTDDIIKNSILSEIERLTTIDYTDLENQKKSKGSYNFRYLLGSEIKNDIRDFIIDRAKANHIKINIDDDKNKLKIGISKPALDSFKFKEFKITQLKQLRDYFSGGIKDVRLDKMRKVYTIEFDRIEEEEEEQKQDQNKSDYIERVDYN